MCQTRCLGGRHCFCTVRRTVGQVTAKHACLVEDCSSHGCVSLQVACSAKTASGQKYQTHRCGARPRSRAGMRRIVGQVAAQVARPGEYLHGCLSFRAFGRDSISRARFLEDVRDLCWWWSKAASSHNFYVWTLRSLRLPPKHDRLRRWSCECQSEAQLSNLSVRQPPGRRT